VRLYNRALSAEEIDALYRAGAQAAAIANRSHAPPDPPSPTPVSVCYRAINFNGPALKLNGTEWESSAEAPNCLVFGKPYENSIAALDPPVQVDLANLLRTAVTNVGSTAIVLGRVPKGTYLVYLYAWSDGSARRFDVVLEGQTIAQRVTTGAAGRWERLGPWPIEVTDGALNALVSGDAVNLCGIEVRRQ
jgi:hypothetical protein